MDQGWLYSIGHGTRKAEDFLALLQAYGISYLADVRSIPYSRYNPQYNRERLSTLLATHHIRYVYMGDTLGGRPQDAACYDAKGKVDYDRVKSAAFFRRGLQRLVSAGRQQLSLAVMCSESNPAHCHRSRLIGNSLAGEGICLRHIDEQGRLLDHSLLMPGPEPKDLFS